MNWDEIKDGVSKRYSFIGDAACECGGKFISDGQAIGYCEQEKAMVDAIFTKCEKCGKQRDFKFPIRSSYGKAMGAFMEKMQDMKAKGIMLYSGHTVLEGNPYENEGGALKKEYKLKLQCYKCNNIWEYESPKDGWRVACPKCDAS